MLWPPTGSRIISQKPNQQVANTYALLSTGSAPTRMNSSGATQRLHFDFTSISRNCIWKGCCVYEPQLQLNWCRQLLSCARMSFAYEWFNLWLSLLTSVLSVALDVVAMLWVLWLLLVMLTSKCNTTSDSIANFASTIRSYIEAYFATWSRLAT